ncbi:bifunctional demethylmenaquinone methyltransferase/2-methoxy-6-polyprenyl-1,4-benzoquinol methylase UbiE [Patescibacteria group bacterium]|nr:bifunctional demethylmenaquinone methyltransferase/2-methoxy-6-polyprenyl-1,4-benzoquinol methylase UbiE [Patescibacteria group bacterium]
MFDRIASTYDLTNLILSLGIDRLWRRRMMRELPDRDGLRVLDVATGTGDVALALIKRSCVDSVVGLDVSEEMLKIAKRKIEKRHREHAITLVHGDALDLPFLDASFDAVTIAFGIRNVTDVSKALQEMQRVVKSGGRVLILEFSLPASPLIKKLHLFYLRKVVPTVGKIISGNAPAYRYLNKTIETFTYGEQFSQLVQQAGFQKVRAYPLTFGVAMLYIGEKKGV